VGESAFWYRPTRVVPDQRPLNGRCCCCCFSNLLIPPPCLFVSAWSFCHCTYVLSRFHHYTFHLLPVIIYTQAFPFCFLYRPWICTPHMSFPPSASIHALGSKFLRQVFVALNHMSITSSLCFGTHSSLEITLTL